MPRFLLFGLFGLFLCLLPLNAAIAGDLTGRSGLGLELGVMKLTGGDHDYSNLDQHLALRWERGLGQRVSLALALKYGWNRPGVGLPGEDAGFSFDTGAGFYTVLWHPNVQLKYLLAPEARAVPYLGGGIGLMSWKIKDLRSKEGAGLFPDGPVVRGFDTDGKRQDLQKTTPTFNLAAGVDFIASESVAINLGARYHLLLGNDLDNVGLSFFYGAENVDANTSQLEGFLGLTFLFGRVDSDGDGLRDSEDACPDDAEDFDGFEDADGCPDRDNDGDGIGDAEDDCPDTPEDLDGFEDGDGCPDADNDGDGLPDGADGCPEEAEDLDGYEDQDGCPDTDDDGDGVPDEADECRDTPMGVQVNEKGCPVIAEIQAELILEGVQFLSGSARLTGTSMVVLQEVARSLLAYPDVEIEVRGHTDSMGSAEVNRDLSHRRALAVRQALIELGIASSRITAIGYGEDFPIAVNTTAEGRAQNRRVEIHRIER